MSIFLHSKLIMRRASFLTSGSSSFGGCNLELIVHSDSGFQRKAAPLNQRVPLLSFAPSKPLEPSSAGLSFDKMYFHYSIFECFFIAWTLLATKNSSFTFLMKWPKMTLLCIQYFSS